MIRGRPRQGHSFVVWSMRSSPDYLLSAPSRVSMSRAMDVQSFGKRLSISRIHLEHAFQHRPSMVVSSLP